MAAAIVAAHFALPSQGAAIVTGNAVFNSTTSDYTYSYSVMNTGTVDDLVLIAIPADRMSAVMGGAAPIGFDLTFDAFGGWVNLTEDISIVTPQTFAPLSTIGSFTFNSPFAPGMVEYIAYDAAGMEFRGTTAAPVPEPAGAVLCALTLGSTLLSRRRKAL